MFILHLIDLKQYLVSKGLYSPTAFYYNKHFMQVL